MLKNFRNGAARRQGTFSVTKADAAKSATRCRPVQADDALANAPAAQREGKVLCPSAFCKRAQRESSAPHDVNIDFAHRRYESLFNMTWRASWLKHTCFPSALRKSVQHASHPPALNTDFVHRCYESLFSTNPRIRLFDTQNTS